MSVIVWVLGSLMHQAHFKGWWRSAWVKCTLKKSHILRPLFVYLKTKSLNIKDWYSSLKIYIVRSTTYPCMSCHPCWGHTQEDKHTCSYPQCCDMWIHTAILCLHTHSHLYTNQFNCQFNHNTHENNILKLFLFLKKTVSMRVFQHSMELNMRSNKQSIIVQSLIALIK